MRWLWKGGEGPKGIPDWVYPYLVLSLNADPDRLNRCEYIEQPGYFEKKPVLAMRIFESHPNDKVEIEDFASLDRHPEWILYEGYLEIESGKVVISQTGSLSCGLT